MEPLTTLRSGTRWADAALALLMLAATAVAAHGEAPAALVPSAALHAFQQPVAKQSIEPTVAAAPAHHSTYKAALFSALVPGAGEYYTGHYTRSMISGGCEVAIWASYVTFKVQEDMRSDSAIEFAAAYAGATANGDEDYYKAVGQFLRAEGPGMWNEFVRRRARDDGEVVGREYTGAEAWAWTSTRRFNDYRQLRKDSLSAGDHATNALAFALVNRIVSVVSVVQAVRSDHMRNQRALGLLLDAPPDPMTSTWRVGLARRF